ncbi:MAG: tyrosine-type recombinase/integrase, partial [Patescibacteria group bacterium]|nr:tyrosine-type recombinase/integrase [Patescibacteria group bacterium]
MKTLASAIEWFIVHCSSHRKLSAHTLKAYRHDLRLFANFMSKSGMSCAQVHISAIDKNSVQNWLAGMENVKPRTVRRRLATVKSMFSSIERQGHIPNDPLSRFRSEIKVGHSLPRIVGRSTVRALLRSPKKQSESIQSSWRSVQESAVLEMLFSTGMRVCEVSGATIEDVDMERLIISVHGKGNREREIPIVCEAFQEVLARHILWRLSNGGTPDSPLFISRRGTRLSDQSIRSILRRHSKKIGAKRITPHMLRHTIATLLL